MNRTIVKSPRADVAPSRIRRSLWLVSVAQKVAEAAKEGGFLGFGGTRVSEREMSALKDLTLALGANAR